MSPSEIAGLAGKSLMHRFPSNTVILRQGETPTEIFFVKSGRLKVLRRLNFKLNPINRKLDTEDPSEPT